MKPNKILFITHKYPPSTGGMEMFSFELFKGIQIHGNFLLLAYEGKESKAMWFFKLKYRVRKLIKENLDIRLIHLNDGLMAFAGRWIKKEFDIPVVVTLHGLDIVFPLPYFQKKIVPTFNCYDGFACVSEATKIAAQSRGLQVEKLKVILNGVDHKLFHSKSDATLQSKLIDRYKLKDKIVLVGLGRAVKRKGYSWFVKNVLPQLDENVKFILCGPTKNYNGNIYKKILPKKWVENFELMLGLPSDEYELKKLAMEFPDRFIKTGYLPFGEIIQLMKLSGKFIMPNVKMEGDMEGFGLVALESCLAGCIVYASNIDGITSAIIHKKNGILLESQNVEEWIYKLAQNDKQDALIDFQNFTLLHYSWDIMCKEYFQWFESFMDNRV
jgi:phosphatidylinositol alpha-1,6-mannosyltransferase